MRAGDYHAGHAMHWIALTEKDSATDTLEKRLWAAADILPANAAHDNQPI